MIEQELQRIIDDPKATPIVREAAELLLSGVKPDQHIASVLTGYLHKQHTQDRYGKLPCDSN